MKTRLKPLPTSQNENTRCSLFLCCVEPELAPIREQLVDLSVKYRDAGEQRIGWSLLNAVRVLDETISLARLYVSEKPLPTLIEMRGIFNQANDPIS